MWTVKATTVIDVFWGRHFESATVIFPKLPLILAFISESCLWLLLCFNNDSLIPSALLEIILNKDLSLLPHSFFIKTLFSYHDLFISSVISVWTHF